MCLRIIIAFLFVVPSLWGQNKFEVEHRIKSDDVPKIATSFVESLSISGKIRWYYEENLNGNSYEAKIRDGRRYSIEFDTLGNFQDIEIKIKPRDIQRSVHSELRKNIAQIFDSHKIRKIQIQYFEEDIIQEVVAKSTLQFQYPHRYEIVLIGRKAKERKLYELTLNNAGEIIKSEEIIPQNSDLLEY